MANGIPDIEDTAKEPERLYPAVAGYHLKTVRCPPPTDPPGPIKLLYCTCGLSKTQPWCDNSHEGTGFTPLEWLVPGTEVGPEHKPKGIYVPMCICKYSSRLPYCDGSHIHLPTKVEERIAACKQDHSLVEKLCTKCGFVPGKTA
ncbi:hypothetical protein M427DRAFT_99466 [Gonapodya prolifera JEL478]|uniref:Iron-binding zinc finger CDGSH type domain-containing protein n=1 Tax=Gonapodya prolifera (strain JEL478) TaxID=1344416 RepID=A0A139ADW7_GONPJ|nr:hypothetical protein M427DRAFT_99466 [Gonapodya prolifera JEL478]|eukprot:KXS14635.1 hypothetical protein M427DRAFT_99466 [Gonapodya prolifera JEL478]